eukprot:g10964.t1
MIQVWLLCVVAGGFVGTTTGVRVDPPHPTPREEDAYQAGDTLEQTSELAKQLGEALLRGLRDNEAAACPTIPARFPEVFYGWKLSRWEHARDGVELENERTFTLVAGATAATLAAAVEQLRGSRGFFLEAVKADGTALMFAPESWRRDPEIVLEAIQNKPEAFAYAHQELFGTELGASSSGLGTSEKEDFLNAMAAGNYAFPTAAISHWRGSKSTLAGVLTRIDYKLTIEHVPDLESEDAIEDGVLDEILDALLIKEPVLSDEQQRDALERLRARLASGDKKTMATEADGPKTNFEELLEGYCEYWTRDSLDPGERQKLAVAEAYLAQVRAEREAGTAAPRFRLLTFEQFLAENPPGILPELEDPRVGGQRDPRGIATNEYYLPRPFPGLAEKWGAENVRTFLALVKLVEAHTHVKHWHGAAPSRIEEGKNVGTQEYQDNLNNLIWPQGYAEHYIGKHNVPPTLRFVYYIRYRVEWLWRQGRLQELVGGYGGGATVFADPPVVMPPDRTTYALMHPGPMGLGQEEGYWLDKKYR